LHLLWRQNSGCAHEKVYSIFGVAQKAQPASLLQAPGLRVDYEQTPEDAFLSFTTFLMEKLPTLAMLSYVNRERRCNNDALPSWCPDYAIPPKNFPVLTVNQGVTHGLRPISASGDITREGSPCQIIGRTLWVSGKRVALVDKACLPLGLVFDPEPESLFTPNKFEEFLETCLLLDPTYALTAQDRLEVLWRTILLDRECNPCKAWKYLKSDKMYPAFAAFLNF